MSIPLGTLDVSSVIVGQDISVNIKPDTSATTKGVTFSSKDPAKLQIFNESGVGFNATLKGENKSFFLPAGGWPVVPLIPGETELDLNVEYVIPNAPVSKVVLIYYSPGDPIVEMPVLGNSPVGVGGSVQTSGQTLSNESNAPTQLVIDIGNTTINDLIKIFNDGTLDWNVLVAGVAHTIFTIAAAGNFLKIGQANDFVEFLGNLLVDGSFNIVASDIVNGRASGTAELTQVLVGNFKIVGATYDNFKNGGANQDMAIPTPFTTFCAFLSLGAPIFNLVNGGVVANAVSIVTGLSVNGYTNTTTTNVNTNAIGAQNGPVDTVRDPGASSGTHNGVTIFVGI